MKIMVVDDEVPIRRYIVQMIEGCGGEYQVVGSVESAKKALEILKHQAVDLIFADITMPKMTGLELLSQVKSRYPDTDVFMLTCHDDFEYARTAVKLQADNYILKDEVNPEFLRDLLKSAAGKREKRLKKTLSKFEKGSYFMQMMEDEETLLFNSCDMEKYRIFLEDKEFFVISLTYSKENLEKLAAFCTPLLENQEIFPYQETNVVMAANLRNTSAARLQEQAGEVCAGLRGQIEGPLGCSGVYHKISMLKRAVLEAIETYNGFYYGRKDCLSSENGDRQSWKNHRMEFHNLAGQARAMIGEKRYKKLFGTLSEMLAFAAEYKIDVYFLKKTLRDILSEYQLKSTVRFDSRVIAESTCMEQIQEYLETLKISCGLEGAPYSETVGLAIQYMEEHFDKNVGLTQVAEQVHLNPDYFSRRFKKETGHKFSDYLLKIRMEEAKKLLLAAELSVTEIAGRTGFNNDGYFSTTFKKFYGENPNEFRKNSKIC